MGCRLSCEDDGESISEEDGVILVLKGIYINIYLILSNSSK